MQVPDCGCGAQDLNLTGICCVHALNLDGRPARTTAVARWDIDGGRGTQSSVLLLQPLCLKVLGSIFQQETMIQSQHGAHRNRCEATHLYHHTVGITVPKCHRACASTMPHHGGKSKSSKLMAKMIQKTINPGQAAHSLPTFLNLDTENHVHITFVMTPTTTFAAML